MKIVSIVGARPQFIKCAPLSQELRKEHEEILIHTGQHYDTKMSHIFFNELGIPKPDYNLGIGSGTNGEQTGKMLIKIETVLIEQKPDIVIVYGDTNSTLAGSLAASKLNIKIAHVEAGLRSFDRIMPEEINRVLTDHMSNILFCPTENAITNLKKEGITENVYNVGDVMTDALQYNKLIADEKSKILENLNLSSKEYIVTTIHRPSNTDNFEKLSSVVNALCNLNKKIVFPVHPRTKKYLKKYDLWDTLYQNVKIIEPLGYIDMLHLMSHSEKILTDSGGVQKEAYMLGVPCITLRDNTEWVETINDGWNILVGSNCEQIIQNVNSFNPSKLQSNVFGKQNVSKSIVKKIEGYMFSL